MVGLLTDAEHYIVTIDGDLLGIIELRIESAFAVLDAEAFPEFYAFDLAAGILEDLSLAPACMQFDAVALAQLLILAAHRHLIV